MTLEIKITNLKKAEDSLNGMKIPAGVDNIPRFVEDHLESLGYSMNAGSGVDIPGLGVEVKTRNINATSPRQIGTMTWMDILTTDWDNSPLKEKFQQQFIVYYCSKTYTILSAKMYDFRHNDIQKIMEEAYESARTIFVQESLKGAKSPDDFGNYIRGEGTKAYFEHHISNSYQFRFPSSTTTLVEKMAEIGNNRLFNFGE